MVSYALIVVDGRPHLEHYLELRLIHLYLFQWFEWWHYMQTVHTYTPVLEYDHDESQSQRAIHRVGIDWKKLMDQFHRPPHP
jgi:hypothetical protein